MIVRIAVIGAATTLLLTSCNVMDPIACTDEARPYLVVEVRDAQTSAPAARDARGTVRDGNFSDTLDVHTELLMQASEWERPGIYDVTIQKPGYRDWRAQRVRVRAGKCHVRTVKLQARLERGS